MALRVAHVISTPMGMGGAERVVVALLEHGARRGWDQLALNPFNVDPTRSPLTGLGADYVSLSYRRPTDLVGLGIRLHAHLRRFRPDIVHAHLFHAAVAVAAFPRPAGSATVLTNHHADLLRRQGRSREDRLDAWAGRRYDRVVAVSREVEQFLLSTRGYPREQVVHIPNGWSGVPRPRGAKVPQTIVCVGHMRREKGHDVLLEAFASVAEQVPARLLLIGDGPLRGELEARSARLGISGLVEFRGAVDEVWEPLAEGDVFVAPSRYETLGIAVLEAMAAGLPVVATAVGGLPELVAPGETGLLVRPDDAVGLADALLRLLRDPGMADTMGTAGRERAAGMRISETVIAYEQLYRTLAPNQLGLA